MAKTVEEIKAEVTTLVKSQGDQGAITLGTVLDDIADLANEGGSGGTPNVIQISSEDGEHWAIENPDDLETFAEKASTGECVVLKMSGSDPHAGSTTAWSNLKYLKSSLVSVFIMTETTVTNDGVTNSLVSIDVASQTVTVATTSYPSN